MAMRKCQWCGKEYDYDDRIDPHRRGYCCKKCEEEAKAAKK